MTCLGQFGIACAAWLLAVPLLVLAQAPRSPAERAIESARIALAKNSEKAAPYNRLAMALARRARETSDPVKYEEASAALEKSFELEPDNFEGLKIRAWLLLGRHEFARALDLAEQLKQRVPDDATVYGLLTDAHTRLGNYKKAEEEAQRMLDVGRASVPGLTRAAYLRELFGDIDGATELMVSAYRRTNPAESEDRAWILTQVAHLHLLTGRLEEASRSLDEALRLFPGYHYALAHSAKVLAAQQRHAEAADLLRRRYQAAPHAENLFDLAVALKRAGKEDEAQRAFSEFEGRSRAEMNIRDNSNHELIAYYSDYAGNPKEALRVAEVEIDRRRDVYTLDAYAWALHGNGRNREARKHIEEALTVGIRDAKILYHAGVIALALDDQAAAAEYLHHAL